MIRQPTPDEDAYRWHRCRIEDTPEFDPRISIPDPQCGWFKTYLVSGGPWVAARIWIEREVDPLTGELVDDERLLCEVNGIRRDPEKWWDRLCGNPITKAEFDYLNHLRLWAIEHAPDAPEANPHQAIDWLRTPPPTFSTPVQKERPL